jgi:hypothetical protein
MHSIDGALCTERKSRNSISTRYGVRDLIWFLPPLHFLCLNSFVPPKLHLHIGTFHHLVITWGDSWKLDCALNSPSHRHDRGSIDVTYMPDFIVYILLYELFTRFQLQNFQGPRFAWASYLYMAKTALWTAKIMALKCVNLYQNFQILYLDRTFQPVLQ